MLNMFAPPPGLLGDQEEAVRQQMQMQGLLGLAAGLFQAGTPSRTPVSLGGSALQGLAAGQQAAQGTFDQTLKAMQLRQQMADAKEKRDREALVRKTMPQIITTTGSSPGSFGRGLSMSDPVAEQMARENLELGGGQGLSMLEASANYPVQGTSQEQFASAPETKMGLNPQALALLRSALPAKDYLDIVKAAKEQLEISQPKPEYLRLENTLYLKDPTAPDGLRMVINNSGRLTGEYSNIALGLYKTNDPQKLSQNQFNSVVSEVNRKAASGASNISLRTQETLGGVLARGVAEDDLSLRKVASNAPAALETIATSKKLLSEGKIFTGKGANVKLEFAKFGQALGMTGSNTNEVISNTTELLKNRARSTLNNIKTSGLGAGQGFTDRDREFLEKAVLGNINYDAESLRRQLDIEESIERAVVKKWNNRLKDIPEIFVKDLGFKPVNVPLPSGVASVRESPQ